MLHLMTAGQLGALLQKFDTLGFYEKNILAFPTPVPIRTLKSIIIGKPSNTYFSESEQIQIILELSLLQSVNYTNSRVVKFIAELRDAIGPLCEVFLALDKAEMLTKTYKIITDNSVRVTQLYVTSSESYFVLALQAAIKELQLHNRLNQAYILWTVSVLRARTAKRIFQPTFEELLKTLLDASVLSFRWAETLINTDDPYVKTSIYASHGKKYDVLDRDLFDRTAEHPYPFDCAEQLVALTKQPTLNTRANQDFIIAHKNPESAYRAVLAICSYPAELPKNLKDMLILDDPLAYIEDIAALYRTRCLTEETALSRFLAGQRIHGKFPGCVSLLSQHNLLTIKTYNLLLYYEFANQIAIVLTLIGKKALEPQVIEMLTPKGVYAIDVLIEVITKFKTAFPNTDLDDATLNILLTSPVPTVAAECIIRLIQKKCWDQETQAVITEAGTHVKVLTSSILKLHSSDLLSAEVLSAYRKTLQQHMVATNCDADKQPIRTPKLCC